MGTGTPAPRVLVIGLDPYRVPGPWDPEPVATAVAAAMAEFEAQGIDAVNCAVGLDGSDDVPAVVTRALQSGPWDCVLVGGGIRKAERLFALFEDVVNLVHRHAPGSAIAFNDGLDDIVEAARRRLG